MSFEGYDHRFPEFTERGEGFRPASCEAPAKWVQLAISGGVADADPKGVPARFHTLVAAEPTKELRG